MKEKGNQYYCSMEQPTFLREQTAKSGDGCLTLYTQRLKIKYC